MPSFRRLCVPTALVLASLTCLLQDASAQSTVVECGPDLLPLAPCAPFVQGVAAMPIRMCCDSLAHLYSQKPSCICMLLHDTSFASSFPINATLALRLPALCRLRIDPSTCAGTPLTPPTGISLGLRPNASIAASPVVTVAPRPSSMVFGVHHSAEVRLKPECRLMMLQLAAIFAALTKLAEP